MQEIHTFPLIHEKVSKITNNGVAGAGPLLRFYGVSMEILLGFIPLENTPRVQVINTISLHAKIIPRDRCCFMRVIFFH